MLKIHKILEEWRNNTLISRYKNKDDVQVCGHYRRIKILSHTMKLWERVIEWRIKKETVIRENQFGFIPGRSTTEAIHVLRRLIQKYRDRKNNFHLVFINLEKVYDGIPWRIIWDSFKARGISLRYIEAIHDMYDRDSLIYLEIGGNISPFIFTFIIEEIS